MYIEITDVLNVTRILNISNMADIELNGSTIEFNYAGSYTSSITFTNATLALEIYTKISRILSVVNINKLPLQ